MEYVELDNLSDEAILNLYDEVIAWTMRRCDGTGNEVYVENEYYGRADRYSFYTDYMPKGSCFYYHSIVCGATVDCCEPNERCSSGYSLKYGVYSEFSQE